MEKPKIAVIGDGGWGTTLSLLLNKKGFKVTIWCAFSEYAAYLDKKRINTKFLPKIRIPREITITSDIETAVARKDLIILAAPSQYMRQVLKRIKKIDFPKKAIYLSVTKGIEINTLERMTSVIRDELGNVAGAVLSGPTIAHEVAYGVPTTVVVAASNSKLCKYLQDIFMCESFRVYTSSDIIGVELGGSIKNVIAIACGISDGLGFGTNTKAALLSRGLAEISRLGVAMGAKLKTFSGISGLGDLVTTCISPYSRNRYVGEQIGKGISLEQLNKTMQMVAEGVPTAKSTYALSKKYKVAMPIIREVYLVLYKNKSPKDAVRYLMTRQKKAE
ncbi:MAG: NAD(P)H-dependent glycerol-3-phosphate dehydrogenase [Candidatus Omnitrophota bacterium]|nr:NAD(P)-dependent glycerol-3-phosphate dehydrogenase [Candidatus Omnitrophota bacterium]MBU1929209.1 NAD(P)-dependent glycerol-3-phosphate dehydrogenase [Candidatus Omnitrophota bacterium]MBU2034542.1 NAD(P)-dependent glycerol-3-phosphate dehydrogenase [Candidatus Omnitrophota bacterium]MBU2221203.1 NAD(P)-dependent glycerol-3-phosphate dehydrogenase [Candidatus Omnitrophota bacterium]